VADITLRFLFVVMNCMNCRLQNIDLSCCLDLVQFLTSSCCFIASHKSAQTLSM